MVGEDPYLSELLGALILRLGNKTKRNRRKKNKTKRKEQDPDRSTALDA